MERPTRKIPYQRKHPRVNLNLKGDFKIPSGDPGSKPLPTDIKMLGCGGLMFESSIPLAKGTRLEMNLFYDNRAIPVTGEIVWAEIPVISKNKEFKCGMRFLTIPHANLLDLHYILYTHLFKPKLKSKRISRPAKNISKGISRH